MSIAKPVQFCIIIYLFQECTPVSDKEKKTETKSGKITIKFKETSGNNDPVLPIFVLAIATASAFYVSLQVSSASFMNARRRH